MPILLTTPDYDPTYPVEKAISYTRSQKLLEKLRKEKEAFEKNLPTITTSERAIIYKIEAIIKEKFLSLTVFEYIAQIKTRKRDLPEALWGESSFITKYYLNHYPIYTIGNEIEVIEKTRQESPIEYARKTMTKTLENLYDEALAGYARGVIDSLGVRWNRTLEKKEATKSDERFPETEEEYEAIKDTWKITSDNQQAQLKKIDAVMGAYFRNKATYNIPVPKKNPTADKEYNELFLTDTKDIWLPMQDQYFAWDLYIHQKERKEKFDSAYTGLTNYPFEQTAKEPIETIEAIETETREAIETRNAINFERITQQKNEEERNNACNDLIGLLEGYLNGRSTTKNQYYWYGLFQCFPNSKSLNQKTDAVMALTRVLQGVKEGKKTVLEEEHISTLRNGKLGDTLRAFIKTGSADVIVPGKRSPRTIRDFIEALNTQNEPTPPSEGSRIK